MAGFEALLDGTKTDSTVGFLWKSKKTHLKTIIQPKLCELVMVQTRWFIL